MEDGRSFLTEYEPIDISTVKPAKIHSEKELESEAASMCEFLKDTSKLLNKNKY